MLLSIKKKKTKKKKTESGERKVITVSRNENGSKFSSLHEKFNSKPVVLALISNNQFMRNIACQRESFDVKAKQFATTVRSLSPNVVASQL
jgi:hypothetical protein